MTQAADLVNALAPEHLELAVEDPEALARDIRHAGAIFLGRYTPEAVGDYIAGPNHVLPTARASRYASGLSVLDFMKRSSLVRCDAASLAEIGPDAMRLADEEGLHAHGRSISIRLNQRPAGSGKMADAPDKRDETSGKSGAADRIVHISLDDPALVARNPDIEHERRVAIFDLIEGNHFRLVSGKTGPFRVRLSLSERGIQFDISDTDDAPLETIDISMAPFAAIFGIISWSARAITTPFAAQRPIKLRPLIRRGGFCIMRVPRHCGHDLPARPILTTIRRGVCSR